jgi:hypothetical protein
VTYIDDYFVEVPPGDEPHFDPTKLPIIICLTHGYAPENVPLGTEVRLAEFL